jgi:carboxylesterase type B
MDSAVYSPGMLLLISFRLYTDIYQFGGDPGHVTIGGDSAGGASVDLQLSAYGGRDDGLFHAAAAESQSFGAQLTVEEAQYQYDGLVDRVGCTNTSDTLACLRNVDIEVITENNNNVPTPGGAGNAPIFMWSNAIDENFTMDYTYNMFSQGNFVKVPAIFGYVSSIYRHVHVSNDQQRRHQ